MKWSSPMQIILHRMQGPIHLQIWCLRLECQLQGFFKIQNVSIILKGEMRHTANSNRSNSTLEKLSSNKHMTLLSSSKIKSIWVTPSSQQFYSHLSAHVEKLMPIPYCFHTNSLDSIRVHQRPGQREVRKVPLQMLIRLKLSAGLNSF